MKVLFIPEGESFSIELVSESTQDRENLIKYWVHQTMSVSCEEWREMADEKDKHGTS
jgi:hypothetical protein